MKAQPLFDLPPVAVDNKFHNGNGDDGKHYWLTPPDLYARLNAEFAFDLDVCPYPIPRGFDGLTSDWGRSNYGNLPFGSIMHEGKKKGATAWVRKAILEQQRGNQSVLLHPLDKWILMNGIAWKPTHWMPLTENETRTSASPMRQGDAGPLHNHDGEHEED